MNHKIGVSSCLFAIVLAMPLSAQWTSNGGITTTPDTVGVGTTGPTEKLHVFGNLFLQGSYLRYDVADGATFDLKPVGRYGFGLRLKPHSSAGGDANRFFQIGRWDNLNGYTPMLHIGDSGFVGIGTSTPGSHLQVADTDTSALGSFDSATQSGMRVEPTSDAASATRMGLFGWGSISGTNSRVVGTVVGVNAYSENLGTGPVGYLAGIQSWAASTGIGAVTNVQSLASYAYVSGSAVTNLVGLDLWNQLYAGSVTNQYGVKIDLGNAASAVGTKYGIYVKNGTGPTTAANYGVYQETALARNYFAGNVLIGTTTPTGSYALEVNGSIKATSVIGATYQDVAEWVPATECMAPGTVVVLNTDRNNEVMPSAHAYDTAVAGVISAQPGVILGVEGPSKAQVATTGRVKVRVDAASAPIRVGDLLVTSDRPGMAMKSIAVQLNGRPFHQPGTLIGKALEPLAGGEGEILVLLSLQ